MGLGKHGSMNHAMTGRYEPMWFINTVFKFLSGTHMHHREKLQMIAVQNITLKALYAAENTDTDLKSGDFYTGSRCITWCNPRNGLNVALKICCTPDASDAWVSIPTSCSSMALDTITQKWLSLTHGTDKERITVQSPSCQVGSHLGSRGSSRLQLLMEWHVQL